MQIRFKTIHLEKRFPLAISRGVLSGSDNLFLSLTMHGHSGFGEMSPDKTAGANTPQQAQQSLESFIQGALPALADMSVQAVYDLAMRQQVPACALAALDIAWWDWLGKQAGKPLYQLLGIAKPKVPTSVTIGINPPAVVKQRVPLLLATGAKSLKIKLGSAAGIDADKAMYAQVVESTRGYNVRLRVDANGGWDVPQAIEMMRWLAARGADYIEQPLKAGAEAELPAIYKNRRLPIYIDESCRFADDVGKWAHCIDGVNLKLMKCGGITEALRIVAAARRHKLKTMIGCKGESSMSIAAAAAISGLIDHIDLDSHLNLAPDPCSGAAMIDGVIVPNDLPGHGAAIKSGF